MGGPKGCSRREIIVALPTLALAAQMPTLARGDIRAKAQCRPIVRRDIRASRSQTETLVAALRRTPGCLRVDIFAATEGGFAIWQHWATADTCQNYWCDAAPRSPQKMLHRLDI